MHAIEYLPPETLRTGELDELTDLYGLGAVLHFGTTHVLADLAGYYLRPAG
ncbi:hypothetical protein [Actinophytocola xinjiangensis]|uniref:hypothetical protein n=1 Tax=Actinophytocola xinjiangensis TaxID=485602 RepID=UPI000B2ACD10|nr:hypothetical protein [Actinophytocola xinjiangensis]